MVHLAIWALKRLFFTAVFGTIALIAMILFFTLFKPESEFSMSLAFTAAAFLGSFLFGIVSQKVGIEEDDEEAELSVVAGLALMLANESENDKHVAARNQLTREVMELSREMELTGIKEIELNIMKELCIVEDGELKPEERAFLNLVIEPHGAHVWYLKTRASVFIGVNASFIDIPQHLRRAVLAHELGHIKEHQKKAPLRVSLHHAVNVSISSEIAIGAFLASLAMIVTDALLADSNKAMLPNQLPSAGSLFLWICAYLGVFVLTMGVFGIFKFVYESKHSQSEELKADRYSVRFAGAEATRELLTKLKTVEDSLAFGPRDDIMECIFQSTHPSFAKRLAEIDRVDKDYPFFD